MQVHQAIFLGIIQGVTEFLPISSDGHLALFQSIFQLTESIVTFDILLHFATLISIIIFFRRQIFTITKTTLILLAIGSLPAMAIGVLLFSVIETLYQSLYLVAAGFLTTAIFLLSTRKINSKLAQPLTPAKAFLIGTTQALAILPGVSRSGSTVSTSLHLHLHRKEAFTFSFLLAIPAIAGATFLELLQTRLVDLIDFNYAVGMITALIVGLFSLKLLQYVTSRAKLHYFGYYCLAMSFLTLYLALTQ